MKVYVYVYQEMYSKVIERHDSTRIELEIS